MESCRTTAGPETSLSCGIEVVQEPHPVGRHDRTWLAQSRCRRLGHDGGVDDLGEEERVALDAHEHLGAAVEQAYSTRCPQELPTQLPHVQGL